MAELLIQCPGEPEQVVALGEKAVTIGRAESCDAFIPEKKASRRHLRVRALEGGGAVAEDQGSSNGTWFAPRLGEPQRFLRRALQDGDEVRIGDTRITLRAATPAVAAPLQADPSPSGSTPLVSGSLMLTPSAPEVAPSAPGGAPGEAVPARAGPEPSVYAEREDRAWEEPRRGGPSRGAIGKVLAFCGVAVAVLVGVELYLGDQAVKKAERKEAHLEALRILEHLDAGADRFQQMRDEFEERHPRSTALRTLDRYAEELRARQRHKLQVESRLQALITRIGAAPASELRRELEDLRRELHADQDFAQRVTRTADGLDRKRAESDMDALRALEAEAERLLVAKAPAQAARRIESFSHAHPGMDAETRTRWRALDARADKAMRETFDAAWARAEEEKDSARRYKLLAAAWPGLAGSTYGTRIGERLRSAAARAAPRSGSGMPSGAGSGSGQPSGAPTVPVVSTRTQKLLARAKKAEALILGRNWVGARAALAALVGEVELGGLKQEWTERLGEVDQILGLVRILAERTDGERKPRCKLSTGSWTITGASPSDVTLESRKAGSKVTSWTDVKSADLLVLLAPRKPQPSDRHAMALLAASVGDRQALVKALVPIYQKGGDVTATNRLVARHLYGLATPPSGGYRAYKGEILDERGYERRVEQERIAYLRTDADRVLALVAKEKVFKKLGRLKKMRDDLDKHRRYALLAIFNTTHYPYPYQRGSRIYTTVQHEIDRRIALAREVWDDPYSIRIKRAGPLEKHLDSWDGIIAELSRRKVDVSALQKRMAPYLMYVTDEPLTIRTYFRDQDEAGWFAYNRWVMNQYNPARRETAAQREWQQVRVTNEYRMLMGYHAVVQPGPASYDAINKDSVVKILDDGKVLKLSPLRAVRIDNRLVMAARLHSIDMGKRGFFAHTAPENPATGEGPTGPADRMRKQAYNGWGFSENIATASDPKTAHVMWCHSSGHHRNIVSLWTDLGSGVAGKGFTQNFGSGGGARPEVYPDTTIRERQSGARRVGKAPRRGQ